MGADLGTYVINSLVGDIAAMGYGRLVLKTADHEVYGANDAFAASEFQSDCQRLRTAAAISPFDRVAVAKEMAEAVVSSAEPFVRDGTAIFASRQMQSFCSSVCLSVDL